MDRPMSAAPPSGLSAISHVQSVVVHNANFNLEQKNVNQSQPLVYDWLTPIDFSSVQNDTFSKHTIGTGTWFFEHKNFQEWFSSEIPSVLWVKGMLGAGKTVLSSIVINHLQRSFPNGQGDIAITFAYCRHSDRYSMTDILASFVKQLAHRHPGVLSLAKSAYMNHRKDGTPPHHEELSDILRKSIPLFNRVYMIVDAVDEFPDDARDNFLKALASFPARLLVTSRPSITPYLLEGKPYIDMGNQNQNDIELFIDQASKESSSLRRLLRGKEELWSQIRGRLKETSRGMFLIASLQVESLKSCTTVNELRNATESFSSNIKDTYLSTWARIEAQPKRHFSLATRAIIWLAYARRPLKISELQHALAVRQDADTFDDDDVTPEETILSVCRGLIVVDRECRIVRFVHFTVLDFFKRLGRHVHPSPHTLITECCLSYLQASQFTGRNIASWEKLLAFLDSKEHPLHHYAYHHWGDHARDCYQEIGHSMPYTVSDFLWKCGQYPCVVNGTDFDLFERSHIIAYYGLRDVSLPVKAECNRLTSIMEFTPLILACAQGNVENVRVLLSRKAGVNSQAKNGHTALYTASENGHEAIVRLLLSHRKINVNRQISSGRTALSGASKMGHEAIVKLLLSHPDITVNTQSNGGLTALFSASNSGHEGVVRLLLSCPDINVNTQTKDGWTALFAASNKGREAVVDLLLSRPDIAVNEENKDGWTALSAACHHGHGAVVRLLLSRLDIAVNTKINDGRTALELSCSKGHQAVVELVLSHPDIAVNTQNDDGWTALAAASDNGHEAVVQLLLSLPDIAVNTPNKGGLTALFSASNSGHEGVLRLLLSCPDINVNTQTKHGWTALFAASNNGREAVVDLLLSHPDIAVNEENKDGWTALSAACHHGHGAVVRLLLSRPGIAVNTQIEGGWTALERACSKGHQEVVELLLSHPGIAVNTQDKNGKTALYSASDTGHKAIVKHLLSHPDITVNTQTNDGQTALYAASKNGHTAVVQLLLSHRNVVLNTPTKEGQTALNAAVHRGHAEVIRLLTDSLRSGFLQKDIGMADDHLYVFSPYRYHS